MLGMQYIVYMYTNTCAPFVSYLFLRFQIHQFDDEKPTKGDQDVRDVHQHQQHGQKHHQGFVHSDRFLKEKQTHPQRQEGDGQGPHLGGVQRVVLGRHSDVGSKMHVPERREGKEGKDGKDGKDGQDGQDGQDGKDGKERIRKRKRNKEQGKKTCLITSIIISHNG